MPALTNRRNLIAGGPGHREGNIQRAARRALIGATTSTVSTVTMMEMAYPTLGPPFPSCVSAAEAQLQEAWARLGALGGNEFSHVETSRDNSEDSNKRLV